MSQIGNPKKLHQSKPHQTWSTSNLKQSYRNSKRVQLFTAEAMGFLRRDVQWLYACDPRSHQAATRLHQKITEGSKTTHESLLLYSTVPIKEKVKCPNFQCLTVFFCSRKFICPSGHHFSDSDSHQPPTTTPYCLGVQKSQTTTWNVKSLINNGI